MESLQRIVFGPHAVAATVGVLRKSDQSGGRREGSWCTRGMGDGRFGEAKNGDHPGSRPARHALPLPLAEGPFWVHKGDVPYVSQGSTRGPNIIEEKKRSGSSGRSLAKGTISIISILAISILDSREFRPFSVFFMHVLCHVFLPDDTVLTVTTGG